MADSIALKEGKAFAFLFFKPISAQAIWELKKTGIQVIMLIEDKRADIVLMKTIF